MPVMEDSGIDSEDKQSNNYEESTVKITQTMAKEKETTAMTDANYVSAVSHMADLEVVFRGSGGPVIGSTAGYRAKAVSTTNGLANTSTAGDSDDSTVNSTQPPPNTCRILQRKLELKVERAKRNYSQYQQQENIRKTQSENLIPINRLPIPGDPEQKPLVDYKSDNSDETEEISFFPAKVKSAQRQRKTELSDTFSIQEMTIDSDLDSDDSGSQNLELLPPMRKSSFLEHVKICFGCGNRRS
ncbi:uncharacterized protein [Eurosta solidaginis]|uniref:uncharacterized protein n=1 Tax=Eurosta solidaginis TaxID=178769 RepID=UPI0035310628